MLYASLVLSSILLVITLWNAYRSEQPILAVVLSGVVLSLGPILLSCFFSAVALQALLLVFAVTVWRGCHWRRWSFLPLSCGATVTAYGIASWIVLQQYHHLRDQFPYVSMEDRLPPPKLLLSVEALPSATEKRLTILEGTLEVDYSSGYGDRRRLDHLEQLHERTIQVFVNQPGFGVARMGGVSEWSLKRGLKREQSLPQPGPRLVPSWSPSILELQPQPPDQEEPNNDLFWLHKSSVMDFVNPKGFGFFKDRRHVAGFQAHQFSEAPVPKEHWSLQTLDLVGLVLHDEPVAYVSANLPRMDELREAPTRPLDDFEAVGLTALRRGEDLFVRGMANDWRVLGAIRSAKQCVSCHGGQRGDLLGAFSYTFARR